jgi:nucleoid DNA-binding protein
MRVVATLTLTASGRLRRPAPLRGRATLTLTASGRLRRPTRLRAAAALTIIATAFAPRGLGAKLQVIRERFTQTVLHQSLQVWVNTLPPGLRLALRVDDGPAVETPFVWENPRGGLPAVLALAGTALPQDGFTHYLTVHAWRETAGIASARSRFTIPVQLAAPPVPMPEWVSARLLRQNSSELPDLVEITWRASTAVAVVAHLRPQASGQSAANVALGAADRDESRLLAEGIGVWFELQDNQRYPVYFGVAGIRGGQQSPVRWCDPPLWIQASDGTPATATVQTPDTEAGTARQFVTAIVVGTASPFKTEIQAAVLAQLGTLSGNGATIIEQALYRLFLRIKDVVRKGGSVTLDHLGTFGIRWSAPRITRHPITGVETVLPAQRQPTFTASPGFKVGTRAGLLLTDAEARSR